MYVCVYNSEGSYKLRTNPILRLRFFYFEKGDSDHSNNIKLPSSTLEYVLYFLQFINLISQDTKNKIANILSENPFF